MLNPGEGRWLLWHAESESLFETKKFAAAKQCVEQGCDDVTGNPEFERRFNRKGKKMPQPRQRRTREVEQEPAVDTQQDEQDLPLHVKYRPASFDFVLGQDAVVKSLQESCSKKTKPHSFLFTGPSGCGKTTLARILASEFNVSSANIVEVDAASNTGIDAMREVTATLRYKGFGETPNKMIIIDECHALSKAAWQSLLKPIEEPPAHVFFAFCTTEPSKVPDTIRTRCASYDLKSVKRDAILDLLEHVVQEERLKVSKKTLELVQESCKGSPRMALVMLSSVLGCTTDDEIIQVLEAPMENTEVIDLCRMLVSGSATWKNVQDTIRRLDEPNPESVRIIVVNYLNACLLGARSERDVPRLLDILYSFSTPCNPTDKMAPIFLAFGNHIFK